MTRTYRNNQQLCNEIKSVLRENGPMIRSRLVTKCNIDYTRLTDALKSMGDDMHYEQGEGDYGDKCLFVSLSPSGALSVKQ